MENETRDEQRKRIVIRLHDWEENNRAGSAGISSALEATVRATLGALHEIGGDPIMVSEHSNQWLKDEARCRALDDLTKEYYNRFHKAGVVDFTIVRLGCMWLVEKFADRLITEYPDMLVGVGGKIMSPPGRMAEEVSRQEREKLEGVTQ